MLLHPVASPGPGSKKGNAKRPLHCPGVKAFAHGCSGDHFWGLGSVGIEKEINAGSSLASTCRQRIIERMRVCIYLLRRLSYCLPRDC